MMEERHPTQNSWGMPAVVYLFLAGLGSGSALVGLISGLLLENKLLAKVGLGIGPPLVILGCFFLLADVGRPKASYLVPLRPNHSWISRGFFIVTAFILLGLFHSFVWIWPLSVVEDFSGTWKLLAIVNAIVALLTAIYPGLLLGCSPIPFWNTPILPVLFTVSSLSTGMAAVILSIDILGVAVPATVVRPLLGLDILLIGFELLLIILYLSGMKLMMTARISVENIVRGRLAVLFWIGLILIGLVFPFVFKLFWGWRIYSAVCILIGGYLLRYIVVKGGIKVPLSVQGVLIPVPEKN